MMNRYQPGERVKVNSLAAKKATIVEILPNGEYKVSIDGAVRMKIFKEIDLMRLKEGTSITIARLKACGFVELNHTPLTDTYKILSADHCTSITRFRINNSFTLSAAHDEHHAMISVDTMEEIQTIFDMLNIKIKAV